MGKKVAVAGLASILVVAMVVAAAVVVTRKNSSDGSPSHGGISSSNKAAEAVCSSTDYKETCRKSLSKTNATDPKLLVQAALEYTVENIGGVIKNSALLKEASKDERVKEALEVCEEVLETAVEDLKRSFDKVGKFDEGKPDDVVEDLKTWLSAVGTYQETCIDAFENTTSDAGEKMKNLLKTAKELSSNGLAMLSGISSLISLLNVETLKSGRKLLSDEGRLLYSYGDNSQPTSMATVNAVVAQDGSGQFKSINDAINSLPKKNNQTFVIYVRAGVYKEIVKIPKGKNKIVVMGEGPSKTRVSGDLNFANGVKTYHTATFAVNSDDFLAKDIAFENTAGPEGHQAVALRVSGDRAIFHNVHIDGYQDSLYAHTYRQYYRDCSISGTIDFVFGDALALFQNCKFVVRKPMDNQGCMVTAQGRIDSRSQGGIVILNGTISATREFLNTKPPLKAYLGRPWKERSRTIIMQSNIEGFIAPEGWSPWMGNFALDTLFYAEYQNRGPGSDQNKRVKWKGVQHFDKQTAEKWTGGKAFGGDSWIAKSGVPYVPTMMKIRSSD